MIQEMSCGEAKSYGQKEHTQYSFTDFDLFMRVLHTRHGRGHSRPPAASPTFRSFKEPNIDIKVLFNFPHLQ